MVEMAYKPEGYTSLAPYLIVSDVKPVLDFLKAVFDVDPILVHPMPGNPYGHVEVLIDDTVLMLGQMPGAAFPAHIHIYVPDVDATFAKALAAGGSSVQDPVRKDDVDRRGGVTDPSGTTWWFSTQQEPRPMEV